MMLGQQPWMRPPRQALTSLPEDGSFLENETCFTGAMPGQVYCPTPWPLQLLQCYCKVWTVRHLFLCAHALEGLAQLPRCGMAP